MRTDFNTFFTKEAYDTEIGLDVNADVLTRIYNDGITSNDRLPIEFVFITDTEDKAITLQKSLLQTYIEYNNIEVSEAEDYWEIYGVTNPILMSLDEVNPWNQEMWNIGYQHDCQLDGWQVGT